MNHKGTSLIAGKEGSRGGNIFYSLNPSTGERNPGQFVVANQDDIEEAIRKAKEAFEYMRSSSSLDRAGLLNKIADELEAIREELVTTCDLETALGSPRLNGELTRTTGQIKGFANVLREGSYVDAIIDTAIPDRQPLPKPDIRRMSFPIGPVAVFTPNNFPLAFGVLGGDAASCLAAGCPIIVKSHPSHPATSELVAKAVLKAIDQTNFPKGIFSLILDSGINSGKQLARHPDIKAIAFTGSETGGRALFDIASRRSKPIPVYAEMGSINPVVLMPDSFEDDIIGMAQKIVGSVTLGSGQFCTNPGLQIVLNTPESIQLIDEVFKIMSSMNPGVLLNEAVQSGLEKSVQLTVAHEEVELLTGGRKGSDDSIAFENTVLKTSARSFLEDKSLQREHFGPAVLYVVCNSFDEVLEVISTLDGNLTATIFTNDQNNEQIRQLVHQIREICGRLIMNGFPTGVEVCYAMTHGGPYPATTAPQTSSVGYTAIRRFIRPISFQNMDAALLPEELLDSNPRNIWRIVDGASTNERI